MSDLLLLYSVFSFLFMVGFCWCDYMDGDAGKITFIYYFISVALSPFVFPIAIGIGYRNN